MMLDLSDIQTDIVHETRKVDFKAALPLGGENVPSEVIEKNKASLIDDACAFLNAGGGQIFIGVSMKGEKFNGFKPLPGSSDAYRDQIRNILTENIDPVPTEFETLAHDVPGGWILELRIPPHDLKPYQNKRTGSFIIRVDSGNNRLPRNEIGAYFKSRDDIALEHDRIWTTSPWDRLRRSMYGGGPCLLMSILPQEYFREVHPVIRAGIPLPNAGRHVYYALSMPSFSAHPKYHYDLPFKSVSGGIEALSTHSEHDDETFIERTFIEDSGLCQAVIAKPIEIHPRGGEIELFCERVAHYVGSLNEVYQKLEFAGPYHMLFELAGFHRDPKAKHLFNGASGVKPSKGLCCGTLDKAAEFIGDHVRRARGR